MNTNQTSTIEMPQYQCHKKVRAFQIEEILNDDPDLGDGAHLYGVNDEDLDVDAEYLKKHKPEAGGYYVIYEDGYTSYSPAHAFEAGYALVGSFEARMIAERDELKAKIEKLGAFTSSDQMQDCSAEYQTLLVNQMQYMTDYAITLDQRIELLDLS